MGATSKPGDRVSGLGLRDRFHAWLSTTPEGSDVREYYTNGTIVLDSSVLLNLYEVTAQSRTEILGALSHVADRLWLPDHVGVEFLRARQDCVARRRKAFSEARQRVNNAFQGAASQLKAVRDEVESLVRKHSFGDNAELAHALLPDDPFGQLNDVVSWKEGLIGEIDRIAEAYDLRPEAINDDDPVLSVLERLYGDRIGSGFSGTETARLVSTAVTYRFPNSIPPGYKDAEGGGKKPTDLLRAGDYLIWEEILREAEGSQYAVLLVTLDVKEDWWTLDRQGRPTAARPELVDEMIRRAGVAFRMETLQSFMSNVSEVFGLELSEQVAVELERTADQNLADKELQAEAVDFFTASSEQAEVWRQIAWSTADLVRGSLPPPDDPTGSPLAVLAIPDVEPSKAREWTLTRLPVGGGIRNVWLVPWVAEALRVLPVPESNRLRVELGHALSRSVSLGDG
ncbi:putative nucleic acid-binding protein [Catenulispora sp. EB89]|uniref:PIN-like domain-containing protein n=1 Tax=Catenulispora sp. EB89 TaxID=3156257 RepID=UPI0035140124